MKTQNRKAKKHHNQINEGFVRYSFSEYVHRQGDEQFDEFTGIGKALGGMWNKLTQNQRPGGAPRASAPDAAPAQAPAAGAEAQAPTNNIITVYDEAELDTWTKLSDNPNLTFDFISKYHKKPWNYYVLASNPFPAAKKQFKKEYLAALKIQEAFARAKYIPLYA